METRAIHVPLDVYKFLLRVAKRNRRTVPQQVRVIVENLKKNDENP